MNNHQEIETAKNGAFNKFLNTVEKIGNKLPHPFMLFFYLTLILVAISFILGVMNASVIHPNTGETVAVNNLLSKEGVRYILGNTLTNFTGFAPLGLVLTMMLGIGLSERVGLFSALMTKAIIKTPKRIVTFMVVFIGILGNIASDAAFVVIPPLAALVFLSLGRHPLAGLAAGLAGAGIGFTANILVAGTDALLSGITTEIAKSIDSEMVVSPLDNWFFMSASTFLLAFLGAIVTDKIVEPRLGTYNGEKKADLHELTPLENKALRNTGIAALLFIGFILVLMFIPNSPLLNDDGTLLRSPFLSGIVPILFAFFLVTGITYGMSVKKIEKIADVPNLMAEAIRDLSSYIVLIFMIGQFIGYFNWTNIATWMAVHLANILTAINLTNVFAIVLFTLLVAVLSLFIISGSALWSLVAPIFVPTFMLLGYHPAFVQLAYRIGESSTNMVTPLNQYFAIILGFMLIYNKRAGIGTLMSLMIPYTIIFLIAWILLMLVFVMFNIPIGPGVHYLLK
ncbi:AbgT family transporter [Ureibacillus sp. 179-F W5.1 NHS]|uniref:AbgT family transporter n=1 Tax=Lysinibacillus halotolerans TaxID=1368476 RepID=A0A3M8HED7_9BACI|nr:AbgT family transporter [Lysinibacillus halotolerans]RND00808.1 AbgT family transporter [Lysinibacillus halotolerans]